MSSGGVGGGGISQEDKRTIKKAIAILIFPAIGLLIAWVSYLTTQPGVTVTAKHQCVQNHKPAYCLVESTGHVVYVPYSTYRSTQIGDNVTTEHDGSVDVSHPDPVDVHPVIVDPGR